MTQDARWIQRLNNFKKAITKLSEAVNNTELSELEQEGLIQRFEYTYELAWNTIKDFYEYQGLTGIQGSRDAFRLAFQRALIDNGEVWMDMIESRKLSVHTYDQQTADEIMEKVRVDYLEQFKTLLGRLSKEASTTR